MSMSVTNTPGFGIMAQLAANASQSQLLVDKLTEQSSTNLVSTSYSGLGDQVGTALTLQPQVAQIATWQQTISQAQSRLQVSQSVLSQIGSIAQTALTQVLSLNNTTSTGVAIAAQQAQESLQQMASLLNTRDGDVYVFAGDDTGNPPIPDADGITSSAFFTQIQSAVAGLDTNGAAATQAATLAAATAPANSVFSTTLGTAAPSVDVGLDAPVQVGILANTNAAAVSGGTDTTGSYVVDLMRTLATIGSLTPAQTAAPDFNSLMTDLTGDLQNTIAALSTDTSVMGGWQSELTMQSTHLTTVSDALTAQVSSVEDVDVPTTATRLAAAQNQLQASFQLIATMKDLSLVDFL